MTFKIPKHVAIILDGNRRYAQKLGLPAWKGHEYGLRKLEELFKWCLELGVKELTIYCFSTENFKRTKQEVDYIFNLFWQEFSKIKQGKGVFKDKVKTELISIKQELLRTQERFENLQKAVIGKVAEYNKGLSTVSTDITALEKVFEKILVPLTTNIRELKKVTTELKGKTRKSKKGN